MDYKENIKQNCRDYLRCFFSLRKVQEQLSGLIASKVADCFRADGLMSSLTQKDIVIRFSDGKDYDDISVTVILPVEDGGLPLYLNGQVLDSIRNSFGLLPNHLFVGIDHRKGGSPRLYVQWFLDHLSYGSGFDWEKEIESFNNGNK